jgi:ER-bound oxygenase mpaB/B'/Rubber oxygenase, catalytic domain
MLRGFPFNLALRLFMREDIRATPAQLEHFRRFATVGDPLADELVAEMRSLPAGEGRRLFEHALDHGIAAVGDPPPALAAFFAHVESAHVWLDNGKLDLAARTITRSGLLGVYGPLPDIALIGGYLASKPDKVLMRAGDLDRKAPSRLAETANWLVEVTSPHGLERFAEGFKAIVRVRLTHAHIRAAMHARDDWDYEQWDHPVNQIHTVGTLILFSTGLTAGLQTLGFRFTNREREAIFHLWRYVGHLIGVHPDLLPATESDTWRIVWLEAATEFHPDEDSRRLAQAMLASTAQTHGIQADSPPARLATWLLLSLHASYSRLALGNRNADQLGIPNRPPFHAAILALAACNYALESARQRLPGATTISTYLGDKTRRAALRAVARNTGADLTYTRDTDTHDRDVRAAA